MLRLLCLVMLTLGVADAGKLFYKLQQATVDDTVCPDKVSKCPATATCCQLENKQWGCCPFVQATCCSDNVHCCPNEYSCNPAKGECVRTINNDTIPWAKKEAAPLNSEETNPGNSLLCPDHVSVCAGTASCCRTYSGTYRCCTYPNDVCCADGLSCCPRCSICDLVNRRCISGFQTSDWASLTPSEPSVTKASMKIPASEVTTSESKEQLSDPLNVVWCDSSHYCSDGYTCCWLPSGQWGCCPLPSAVCCTGSVYCCPYGRRCTNPPGGCV